MKISLNWLKAYVDIPESPEALSALLTGCGLEVEALEPVFSGGAQLDGLVVGHVVQCEKHPNADKLSLTRVDVGEDRLLQIVCGAPNVAEGQKVVVARVGKTLQTPKGEITLAKVKIRGEESEGMICAEDEIGTGHSHDGIIVLDSGAVVGKPASEYVGKVTDYTFEIGLTPNRADATSHIGVARDIAAVHSLQNPETVRFPSVESFRTDNNNLPIPVIIEDPEACPRYCGVTVSGIRVGESPDWLKERLVSIGLHPINNVVDITNFILHELGQPLHAFDADKIRGGKVIVKKMPEETPFVTLDNVERKLTSGDLMICNTEEPMCIAGVYGGIHSGVTENTKNIFIESAYFNPVSIRKSARHHGLKTDASFRFERGANPELTLYAMKRAALLVKEICGGEISSEICDVYPLPQEPFPVEFSIARLNEFTGCEIPEVAVRKILTALEMQIVSEENGVMKLKVPPYRADVRREIDVIEDILRIYGYNNIPMPGQMRISVGMSKYPDKEKLLNRVAEQLVATGFSEIWCNSLTSEEYAREYETYRPENAVHLKNPLSSELGMMRQTMLFGGLEAIVFNQNRRNPNLKLFEFGKCYRADSGIPADQGLKKYSESEFLALWVTGREYLESWNTTDEEAGFYFLKNALLNVFSYSGIRNVAIVRREEKRDVAEKYFSLTDAGGNQLAELFAVSLPVLKKFDIRRPVWHACIHWDAFLSGVSSNKITFTDIPRFPEVRRDLALLIDREVTFEQIIRVAGELRSSLIRDMNLFDVYEGEKLPAGKKSYAVSFLLRDDEKTLSDEEIEALMNQLMNALKEKLGAQIR